MYTESDIFIWLFFETFPVCVVISIVLMTFDVQVIKIFISEVPSSLGSSEQLRQQPDTGIKVIYWRSGTLPTYKVSTSELLYFLRYCLRHQCPTDLYLHVLYLWATVPIGIGIPLYSTYTQSFNFRHTLLPGISLLSNHPPNQPPCQPTTHPISSVWHRTASGAPRNRWNKLYYGVINSMRIHFMAQFN